MALKKTKYLQQITLQQVKIIMKENNLFVPNGTEFDYPKVKFPQYSGGNIRVFPKDHKFRKGRPKGFSFDKLKDFD